MDYDWRSMNVGVTYAYSILDVNGFKTMMHILMKGLTIRTLVFCDSLVLRGRSYFGDERVGEGWRWTTKSRGVILRCGKQQHHPYQQWRGSIGIALGGF